MNDSTTIRYERDADGIVTLTLDEPGARANTMNDAFRSSMHAVAERLRAETDDIAGVLVTSAKETFFAGGDLTGLRAVTPELVGPTFEMIEAVKADLRAIETLGKPVVAVLAGSALGAGLEIALACHHRVAVRNPRSRFGFPEVTLGLLPGAGGVTRTVRMLGIADALMNVLGQGRQFRADDALEAGLVDEVVDSPQEAIAAARAWIADHPQATQPWDEKGYRIPGGTPSTPKLAAILPSFSAVLDKQLKGAPMPAPHAILAAAVEGTQVDFDTASRIESRYLTSLLAGRTSTNMIDAFFFGLQAIKKGASRPKGVEPREVRRVAVLGAGMMGAGIAYTCAKAGIDVVLKDVSAEAAERGKGYSVGLVEKAVGRGRTTREKGDALLARITPTASADDLDGCDVVVEAVFEDPELKAATFAEAVPHLAPDALLCSNTSSLPITGLAEAVDRPADFLGLHFFSPVDKMPLVEIVLGEKTGDEALARAYDLVLAIGKTPIVVHDSRGFFTSRVIGTAVNEGLSMLAEGVAPMSIERAGTQAGYPVGTLQLSDELNLELMRHIRRAAQEAARAEGRPEPTHPADRVVDAMLDAGRPGKKGGAGFFDYEDGRRARLWPGLAELFPIAAERPDFEELKDRLLFVEALDSIRCLEEGVLASVVDGNIGSILGIGYPAWTGGVFEFADGYPGGLPAFVERARELQSRHGDRFAPPQLLLDKAAAGETFGG